MKAIVLQTQLAEIKNTAIELIKEKLNGLNHEFITDEQIEDLDFDGVYIGLRNDNGEVYDVFLKAIENGKIMTYNYDAYNNQTKQILLGDFADIEDLLTFLGVLEDILGEPSSPQGDFVSDGSHYQLCDYVFEPCNDDEGNTYYEVRDFDDNLLDEIHGVTLPDENDIEEILKFESVLITWLKGKNLI